MAEKHTIDFRYAPPISWTSICRPDDPYKTLVREDGGLLYGFVANSNESFYFERVIEFSIQTAHGPISIHQQTESPRVPVVLTTLEYEHATLELRAFGHLHDDDRRTDVVLWTIRAHEDVEEEILTGIHIDAYERNRIFGGRSDALAHAIFAIDPATLPPPNRWSDARFLIEDGSLPAPGELAFIAAPQRLKKAHTSGFRPGSGLMMEPVILHAGESVGGAVLLPLNHAGDEHLDDEWAQRALEAERAFWNDLPLPALKFEVPDPDVMAMLTACARNILQAREIEDGLPVFKVGPTVYRNLFVVDGHFMLETAQYLGYAKEASAAVDTLKRRVRPDGAIAEMPHHTKETGISIATFVRQCELLGDDERLRTLWPVIQNGVAYIERLRGQARALPHNDPCHNLLPAAFGDGGVGGERGEYTTTAWILVGLKAAADAARRLDYAGDAMRFQTDFDSLMADFRRHTAQNRRTLPDGAPVLPVCFPESGAHHWMPDYPGTPDAWHHLQPESGTWAYCQAIWPGEVFAPDDPFVQNLNHLHDLRDDDEGIPATTGWLPYRALWGYHASFAAHVWLYSGRPDKAVDYLYAFANHATPTRVWREEQSLKATGNGQMIGDMPHNWASAEFIRLLRHLLVFERGDTLELLPGLPGEWIHPGAVLHLERTPTRFGPVSLHLEVQESQTIELEIEFDMHWPRRPQKCVLFLPDARQLVVDNLPAVKESDGGFTVPVQQSVRVRAALEGIGEAKGVK